MFQVSLTPMLVNSAIRDYCFEPEIHRLFSRFKIPLRQAKHFIFNLYSHLIREMLYIQLALLSFIPITLF